MSRCVWSRLLILPRATMRASGGAEVIVVASALAASIGMPHAEATMHWVVTAEEAQLHEVPVGEVPASCGFPGFDSPLFWDGINALWPDCAAAGGTWGHRFVRRDNPATVVDPGVHTRDYAPSAREISDCTVPCCCDPDCPDPPGSSTTTLDLEMTVGRQWE